MPKASRRQRGNGGGIRHPQNAQGMPPMSGHATTSPRPPFYLAIVDTVMAIPLLNICFWYLLRLIIKISDFLLFYWRTPREAVEGFLSLGPRSKPGMFHLHLCMRQSITGGEDAAFVIGVDVASRYSLFVVPTKMSVTANELLPITMKELCESIIRANQDDPTIGKPSLITTNDYLTYFELVKRFQKHGITLLRKSDSDVMLGRPDSGQDPIPLSAVTDALATTVDRDAGLLLQNSPLLEPKVAESFKRKKSAAGMTKSTVRRENDNVPPMVEFCSHCARLFQSHQLLVCSVCKFPGYCSQKCQKKDWKDHKQVCKHLEIAKCAGGWIE